MRYKFTTSFQEGLQTDHDRFLFNTEAFWSDTSPIFCGLLDEANNHLMAEVFFGRIGAKAVSPAKGSFGCVQFSKVLKLPALYEFIDAYEAYLLSIGINEVQMRAYPFGYDEALSQVLFYCLMSKGYKILYSDLNYHLDLAREFTSQLKQSGLARIKAANALGLRYQKEQEPDLDLFYDMIKSCRDRKGYPTNLDPSQFKQMFYEHPEVYQAHGVYLGTELAAAGVTVHINRSVTYNFFVADNEKYRKHSPVVILLHGMVEEAKKANYSIFDLGIGTDRGEPNFDLLNFKKNMGGIPSVKPIYHKVLTP